MKSLQDLRFIPKPSPFIQTPTTHLPISLSIPFSTPKSHQHPVSTQKTPSLSSTLSFSKISATHLPNSPKFHVPTQKIPSLLNFTATHLKKLALLTSLSSPLPSFAAETEQASDKINIESVLVSIDDFFNRYPFFVAGCAFIWLVVIPLTEEYLKKYKFISAIDAFRKLRDLPNSELLDIRKKQSVNYLNSPNLKVLNKSVAQVEFVEGEEEGFVMEVLKRLGDPGNTVLCVLDNFDGNSLKVAELLFKGGFKEVYAIKGGLRGKDGWQEIQKTLLPPSVHVYPRKKKSKSSAQLEKTRERIDEKNNRNGKVPSSSSVKQERNQNSENGRTKPVETSPEAILANGRPLSPYPKINPMYDNDYDDGDLMSIVRSCSRMKRKKMITPTALEPPQTHPSSTQPQKPHAVESYKKKKDKKKIVVMQNSSIVSNDNWAWRKYGEKSIQKCSYRRSYYKCSTCNSCPARKTVDKSQMEPMRFIITYTEEHNHPLPTHCDSAAGTIHLKCSASSSSSGSRKAMGAEASSSTTEPLKTTTSSLMEEDKKIVGEDELLFLGIDPILKTPVATGYSSFFDYVEDPFLSYTSNI